MTPDELDAIRERASEPYPTGYQSTPMNVWAWAYGADVDRDDLLAEVDALESANKRGQAVHAHAKAVVTELSHHGDMTPTAKRVLMNVLDGAE